MPTTMVSKTAQELVKEKHPNAFVHDDGEGIFIRLRETEEEYCAQCNHTYKRNKIPSLCPVLGQAGNVRDAWENAALNLKLK
jgi:hypothetical protein